MNILELALERERPSLNEQTASKGVKLIREKQSAESYFFPAMSEHRVVEDGEAFSHFIFPRGYLVSRGSNASLPAHWAKVPLNHGYAIEWDARTPVATVRDDEYAIAVIGRAHHLAHATADLRQIARILFDARASGRLAYLKELYELAGRYVVIDQGKDGSKIQSDASAMRSVFYSRDGELAASHAGLAAAALGDEAVSAFGAIDWFKETRAGMHPGRSTEYEAVRILTPNTELDLDLAEVARVGPSPRNEVLTAREAAAQIIPLARAQLESLVKSEEVLLSLTAGLDSRVTLALAAPFRDQITCFSYVTRRPGRASPSEGDMEFAQALCADLDVRHRTVVVEGVLGKGALNDVLRRSSRRIHAPSVALAYREQLPMNAVHVRSNIYEIGRSFFRKSNAGKSMPELTGEEFARRVVRNREHVTFKPAVEAFQDWLDVTEFEAVVGYDPYDLYYWELRMGRWLSAAMIESDIAHDTLTLVNSRRILELFLAVSDEERFAASVFDEIINQAWPQLLEYPVNGEMRRSSRSRG